MRPVNWAVDHAGFTVPELDPAVDFFVEALGAQVVVRGGPYDDVGYQWPGEASPEPATLRLAILRLGEHNVELLEYADCDSSPRDDAPRPSEQGAAHLALYVDDISGAVQELSRRDGFHILGEVITEEVGALTGLDWVYVLTPFRLVLELIRWPLGMPYEEQTRARLAGPPAWAA
jgi:catechol 2,3-dioxygenase-like lactoylglutathione lyase family enzyme